MSEYIERNEVLKAMDTWDKFGYTHTGAFVRNPKTDDYVPYVHYEDMVKCVSNFPTADVVSKGKYDELNVRYHRLLESAKILSDAVREYERREDERSD